MTNSGKIRISIVFLLLGISLSGCGGGGSEDKSPDKIYIGTDSAEGVYEGIIIGSQSPEFRLIVLPDGQYWSIYGRTISGDFFANGFIHGTATSTAGKFTSSNAKDYGIYPAQSGLISAVYDVLAKSINGTIGFGASAATFSGNSIPGSLYNFKSVANISAVSGDWNGGNIGGEKVALSVSTNGSATATTSLACKATGVFTPRSDGSNVFDISFLQGAGCALQGQTIRGFAMVYPMASGKSQLIAAVVDDAKTAGTAVFAIR